MLHKRLKWHTDWVDTTDLKGFFNTTLTEKISANQSYMPNQCAIAFLIFKFQRLRGEAK